MYYMVNIKKYIDRFIHQAPIGSSFFSCSILRAFGFLYLINIFQIDLADYNKL